MCPSSANLGLDTNQAKPTLPGPSSPTPQNKVSNICFPSVPEQVPHRVALPGSGSLPLAARSSHICVQAITLPDAFSRADVPRLGSFCRHRKLSLLVSLIIASSQTRQLPDSRLGCPGGGRGRGGAGGGSPLIICLGWEGGRPQPAERCTRADGPSQGCGGADPRTEAETSSTSAASEGKARRELTSVQLLFDR